MRTLFINPITRFSDAPKHVPYGQLQILAILERDYPKISFQLYDANAHRIDDVQTGDLSGLIEVLESDDYDAVAIGGLITAYKYIKQTVKLVRRNTDAAVIAGGGFLSAIPEDMMRLLPEIDYGVIGEGYQTVPELLEALENNSSVEDVKGVIFRNGIKCLQRSPPRPLIPDLDWLPYPAYHYAPLDIYFKNSSILMSKESMNAHRRLDVCFSLGCPFQCKYCWDLAITSNTVHNGRPAKHTLHRHHSPKYVADLIKYLLGKYQVDFFSWLDENIVAHDAMTSFTWLNEIADRLEERYLLPEQREQGSITKPIYHGGTSHPGLIKRETLKTMKRIGFCILPGNRVTTDQGVKPIENIVKGDDILTSEGFQHVHATASRKYDGEAVEITVYGDIPCTMTADHEVLVIKPEQFEKFRDKNIGNPEHWRRRALKKYATFADANWVKAKDVRPNDFVVYPIERVVNSSIDEDTSSLVGYYLAEGYISGNNTSFAFHKNETSYIDEVVNYLTSITKHSPYIRTRNNCTEITTGCLDPRAYLSQFGGSAIKKHLLPWVMHLPLKDQQRIIRNYWRGDGAKNRIGFEIGTVSEILAYQIRDLFLRFDCVPNIYKSTRISKPINGAEVKTNNPMYIVKVSASNSPQILNILDENHNLKRKRSVQYSFIRGNYFFREVRKVRKFHYKGTVHDLQVFAGNFALSGFIVHNCYLDYGLESFDPAILKGLGKGSTPQRNIEAVAMTLEEGIEPIPNQIIGFPDETWESLHRMLDAWEQTGIISKPFLATPYPGSEWFETYRKDILQQYNGSLEDYLLDLGDATSASALLTKKFTPAELIGIQNILADAAKTGNFTRARRLLQLSQLRKESFCQVSE